MRQLFSHTVSLLLLIFILKRVLSEFYYLLISLFYHAGKSVRRIIFALIHLGLSQNFTLSIIQARRINLLTSAGFLLIYIVAKVERDSTLII